MKAHPPPTFETTEAPATETLSAPGEPAPDEAAVIAAIWERSESRYRLRPPPLGAGATAYVWRAYDRELKRDVALKILRRERTDDLSRHRFRQEVRLAQAVSNPHLVRVFDIGHRENGQLTFLTMELAEGGSLRERLRNGPLTITECVRLAEGLLRGLEALHCAGLVHRDVKPGNVLLAGEGRVLLGDLGLVREVSPAEAGMTRHGLLLGTPDYFAPEQYGGEPASPASDVYSAGLVLFEAVTGRRPFASESGGGGLIERLAKPAPRVTSLRREVPRWLSAVIAGLLEREPKKRLSASVALRAVESRGSPRNPRKTLAVVIGAVALVAVGLATFLVLGPGGRFDHFTVVDHRLAGSVVRGYTANGKVLWEREQAAEALGRHMVQLRRGPERDPVLAVLAPVKSRSPIPPFTLETWSLKDGRTLSRWEIPLLTEGDRLDLFGTDDFAPVFHPGTLASVDVDGDGTDELIATALHHPEWPSAALLLEPEKQRARLVFIAGGHMRFAGTADLDGDGHRDLLFTGLDSHLGRFAFLAAVRAGPWLTEPADMGFAHHTVGSPGLPELTRFPLWFRLLPPHLGEEFELQVDELRQVLTLRSSRGPELGLTFEGRFSSSPEVDPRPTIEALVLLEKARKLAEESDPSGASLRFTEARAVAVASGDRYLIESIGRQEAEFLAREGHFAMAQERFEALLRTSEYRPSLAYRAASAFHVGGDLERAIQWYRLALRPMPGDQVASSRQFVLGGLLFALAELGNWSEALAEAKRFRFEQSEPYQRYLEWRSGLPPVPTAETPRWLATDEEIYLDLELRVAAGRPIEHLLEQVDFELQKASLTRGHLRALRGRLLSTLARHEEAAKDFDAGLELMTRMARKDPFARFFLPIARKRAGRADVQLAGRS